MSDEHPHSSSVHQTLISGTLGAPWVFSVLLILVAILLGIAIDRLYVVQDSMRDIKTEFRLIEVQIQDQNAILLREGIVKPGDALDPTAPHK